MRVVIITGFFDEQFIYREHAYANYFNKSLINYTILTSTLPLSQKKSARTIDSNKYNIVRIKPFFSLKDIVFFNFRKELNTIKPDIIHLFDAQQGIALLGAIYAYFNNVKIVYDHELQGLPKGVLARLRFFFLSAPILFLVTFLSDRIRCVTPAGYDLIKCLNPWCISKIRLEPLGYEYKNQTYSLINFDLPVTKNLVSITGYIDIKKNIRPIIAGFVRSNPTHHDAVLLIVGPIDDIKTKLFIQKFSKNIIHYDKLVNQKILEFILLNSKINIWPKSTSTIFEALKYDNFVILPNNNQTSHLISNQLILLKNFNFLNISKNLNDLYSREKVSDHMHFDYQIILKRMLSDYRILYNERKANN